MKILHTIDTGGMYGKEQMLLALIKQQIIHGHDVHVIGFGADDFFIESGKYCYTLHLNHSAELVKSIQHIDYDMIHSHDYKTGIIFAWYNMIHKKNVVRTVHGYTSKGKSWFARIRAYEALDRVLLRFNSKSVAVSRPLAEQLKLKCIDNGIAKVIPTSESNLDRDLVDFCKNGYTLGVAARLSAEKNLAALIKAVAVMEEDNVQLVIFGDGPLRNELERIAGDNDRIWFAGFRSDAKYYFPYLKAYIQPSLTEGMPISVLEAMSLKVPLILSEVGGMEELVRERYAVPCDRDAYEMVNSIKYAIKTDHVSIRVERAYELFQRRFSDYAMYRNYQQLYETMITGD